MLLSSTQQTAQVVKILGMLLCLLHSLDSLATAHQQNGEKDAGPHQALHSAQSVIIDVYAISPVNFSHGIADNRRMYIVHPACEISSNGRHWQPRHTAVRP